MPKAGTKGYNQGIWISQNSTRSQENSKLKKGVHSNSSMFYTFTWKTSRSWLITRAMLKSSVIEEKHQWLCITWKKNGSVMSRKNEEWSNNTTTLEISCQKYTVYNITFITKWTRTHINIKEWQTGVETGHRIWLPVIPEARFSWQNVYHSYNTYVQII